MRPRTRDAVSVFVFPNWFEDFQDHWRIYGGDGLSPKGRIDVCLKGGRPLRRMLGVFPSSPVCFDIGSSTLFESHRARRFARALARSSRLASMGSIPFARVLRQTAAFSRA